MTDAGSGEGDDDGPRVLDRRDNLTVERRRQLMASIGPKSSRPEMAVRRLCHALGYRFRLHRRDLPGTPDLVFPGRCKIVMVHGCFWHSHDACRKGRATPRLTEWRDKLERNVERDARVDRELRFAGWDVLTVWECETRDQSALADRLTTFLGLPGTPLPGRRDATLPGGGPIAEV